MNLETTDLAHRIKVANQYPKSQIDINYENGGIFFEFLEIEVESSEKQIREEIESLSSRRYRDTSVVARLDPLEVLDRIEATVHIGPFSDKHAVYHDCTTSIRYRCSRDNEFGEISPARVKLELSDIFEYIEYRGQSSKFS